MYLETDELSECVSERGIHDALMSLGCGRIEYVILGVSKDSYIQATGSALCGFTVECQHGSLSEHYYAHKEMLIDDVERVFLSYFNGDGVVIDSCSWGKTPRPVKRLNGKRHAVNFSMPPLSICFLAMACFAVVFLSKMHVLAVRCGVFVFFLLFAISIIYLNTTFLRNGYFGGFQSPLVERKKSPFQFWIIIIFGYLFAALIIVVAFMSKR